MKKERKKPPVLISTHNDFSITHRDKRLTTEEKLEISLPLNEYEHKGKGLPEKISKESDHPHFDLSLDIRVAHDSAGNVEIAYAWKNSEKHTVISFPGLTEKQSCAAAGDLLTNIQRLLGNSCLMLATACVENQTKTFEEKRELLSEILESTSNRYKRLLGLGRDKIIEVTEKDGVKTETSIFIDYGAKPQTAEEIEIEKRSFLAEVYSALIEIKKKRILKPKQKDLLPFMFEVYSDPQKKISESFKKYNLNFKTVLFVFDDAADQNEFVNIAVQTRKITDK